MSVMNLLDETRSLLRQYRILPKKRLGQNFMVYRSTFRRMDIHASTNPNDIILDIGAGLGFLSRFLASKCKRVLAVESDRKLSKALHEQLKGFLNVRIVEDDILKAQVPPFNKVVSIPPYHISSLLLPWLFRRKFDCAVLVLQEEFTDRLKASIGSKDYGWLTVVTYCNAEIDLLDKIPKWMFYPQPDVESVIVRLRPKNPPPFTIERKELFKELLKSFFAQRNRRVRKAILSFAKNTGTATLKHANTIADSFPFCNKRVRELTPKNFVTLANGLGKQVQSQTTIQNMNNV